MDDYLAGYGVVALLLGAGVMFVATGLLANRLLRPQVRNAAALTTYECGVDPTEGEDWSHFSVSFYRYGYLYLLFAVEAVFLFPWASVSSDPDLGVASAVEMAIFAGVLALGLGYAWRAGALRWDTNAR